MFYHLLEFFQKLPREVEASIGFPRRESRNLMKSASKKAIENARCSESLPCCNRHACDRKIGRSEEHTSELQSLMRISYAVFCLKKKNKKQSQQSTRNHT